MKRLTKEDLILGAKYWTPQIGYCIYVSEDSNETVYPLRFMDDEGREACYSKKLTSLGGDFEPSVFIKSPFDKEETEKEEPTKVETTFSAESETKKMVIEMYEQDFSYAQIENETGYTKTRVQRIINRYILKEIKNFRNNGNK